MTGKLNIDTQIIDDKVVVQFSGSIDEDANFDKIQNLNQKIYEFDFDKLQLINSCGIREWISYVEGIPAEAKLIYKNCPQIIIEQMNMVHGFVKKGAEIESFYAPYYCESCDNESKIHLKTSQVVDKKAPVVACPKCGASPMEFDAIEEQYFNFLTQGK